MPSLLYFFSGLGLAVLLSVDADILPWQIALRPPTAPADLNATVEGPGEVRLSWGPAQDPESGISGYRVYRDGTEVAFVSSTSFSDTGLDPETRYAYRVAAVNGDGLQGRSTFEVAVRTPATVDTVPPAPPTGLRIIPAP